MTEVQEQQLTGQTGYDYLLHKILNKKATNGLNNPKVKLCRAEWSDDLWNRNSHLTTIGGQSLVWKLSVLLVPVWNVAPPPPELVLGRSIIFLVELVPLVQSGTVCGSKGE